MLLSSKWYSKYLFLLCPLFMVDLHNDMPGPLGGLFSSQHVLKGLVFPKGSSCSHLLLLSSVHCQALLSWWRHKETFVPEKTSRYGLSFCDDFELFHLYDVGLWWQITKTINPTFSLWSWWKNKNWIYNFHQSNIWVHINSFLLSKFSVPNLSHHFAACGGVCAISSVKTRGGGVAEVWWRVVEHSAY